MINWFLISMLIRGLITIIAGLLLIKRVIVFILVRSEVLLLIVPWRSIDETAVEVLSPLIWMAVHSVEAHAFKF